MHETIPNRETLEHIAELFKAFGDTTRVRILSLLLGQERLSLVLVIAQGLKMLLCGLLFDHVLTFYCKRPLSRIVGSVLYSFCGFLLLWGQHYWIGASIVMATLMMLMLELGF